MDYEQRIGQLAREIAGADAEKILIYSEVESGVISADLFFNSSKDETVRFRFASSELEEEIYCYWESSKSEIPGRWRVMRYAITKGKFTIDFKFPEDVNPDEGLSDRRPIAVQECFGDAPIDYSNP
jgi:hypothetical protein